MIYPVQQAVSIPRKTINKQESLAESDNSFPSVRSGEEKKQITVKSLILAQDER